MENEPGNLFLYHFPTNNEFRESSHIKFLKQYPHSNQSIYLDNKSDINIKSKENKMNNNIANNNQIFHIPDNTRNNNMNNNISNNINNKTKNNTKNNTNNNTNNNINNIINNNNDSVTKVLLL